MAAWEFSLAIQCPGCGRTGIAVWRENRSETTRISCEIVRLSEGFSDGGADVTGGESQIICACGTTVPG